MHKSGGCSDPLPYHPGSAAGHTLILAASLPPHTHLLFSFLEYLQQIPCYFTCVCISEIWLPPKKNHSGI